MGLRDKGPKLAPTDAAKPAVEPLRCPTCGAPVPLGDGDVVPCVACGAKVPVPADLRELRRGEREDKTDRAEAEQLYEKLGKPPSALLQTWVNIFVLGVAAITGVIYAIVVIGGVFLVYAVVGLELTLHGLANTLGIDFIDRYGGGWTYAGLAFWMLVLGVLPMWLTTYAKESGELRLELQASLAARAPKRAGFPATCRECGAALEVPPDVYGVRCTYCRSDNLVRLPPEWLELAKSKHEHFHGSIVEAAAKARALRKDQLTTLIIIVVVGSLGVAAMGLIGHIATWIDEDEDVFGYQWSASHGPPRTLERWNGGSIHENERAEYISATWMAMDHRDEIEIVVTTPCPKLTVLRPTTSFELLQDRDHPSFGIALDGTRVARYRAPYTGIFQFFLEPTDTASWHFVHGTAQPLLPLTGCN